MAGRYAYKRVQTGGSDKFRDAPNKNGFSHVAESLQYLLVGGGEARLRAKTRSPRTKAEFGGDGLPGAVRSRISTVPDQRML